MIDFVAVMRGQRTATPLTLGAFPQRSHGQGRPWEARSGPAAWRRRERRKRSSTTRLAIPCWNELTTFRRDSFL